MRIWRRVFQRLAHALYRQRILVLVLVLLAISAGVYSLWRERTMVVASAFGVNPIEVIVEPVDIRPTSDGGVTTTLFLKERTGNRRIGMNVGITEALSIARDKGPRVPAAAPEAYDLTSKTIQSMGGRVERVIVNDGDRTTYRAQVVLSMNGAEPIIIDAKPGDAVALAVRAGAQVFVEDRILDLGSSATPTR